jgi:carbon monoxide dehydrogenase subunit G
MAETTGEARCNVLPEAAWAFVREIENWIPEFQGYQDHVLEPDGTISLRMRGKVGPLTKVTRLRISIVHEQPPNRIEFSMHGMTDALDGDGELTITAVDGGASLVAYRVALEGRGIAAPVLNEFLNFVVPQAIGDLADRISTRLDAE